MNEWWLLGGLVGFALVSSMALVFPLKHQKISSMGLLPLLLVLIGFGYASWGGFSSWREFIRKEKSKQLVQTVMKSIKGPQELIEKLKAKLDETPDSAKGWYLLGRLYSNENELTLARTSFAKAHSLAPDNEAYAVNYAHSLWKTNNEHFTPQIKTLFTTLLDKNPKQPDALAMLAMESYQQKEYKEAISYWQRLLALAPPQSEEAKALRKAIAQAQANSMH